MTFEDLELIAPIKRAIAEEQYTTPTPIQGQTIPPALEGRDILGSAQTGTGKTAAFALPILNRLGKQNKKAVPNAPTVLILAPTRELAIQIGDSIATYGRHLRVRHTLVYGGVGQHKQVRDLDRGVHILVATPGRLLDLMNQGYIELDRLEIFVLDEADRMLDMGFLPDLQRIMRELPEERQSLFFSATLPPKIVDLSRELLTDPVKIEICPERTSVESIEQRLMMVDSGQKKQVLANLLQGEEVGQAIVFCKTKRGATNVTEFLARQSISAIEIHGNKSQNARQRALDAFRRGQVKVLVATDVAARGIDVDGITHVINVDLPIEPECYVHRIGRTGRAGAAGIAISFCSGAERNLLRAIEREIGQKIPMSKDQPPRGERSADEPYDTGSRPGRSGYGNGRPPRRDDRGGRPFRSDDRPRRDSYSNDRPRRDEFASEAPRREAPQRDAAPAEGYRDQPYGRRAGADRAHGGRDNEGYRRSFDSSRPSGTDRPARNGYQGGSDRYQGGSDRPAKYVPKKRFGQSEGRPAGEGAPRERSDYTTDRPARPRREESSAQRPEKRPAGQGRPPAGPGSRPAKGGPRRPTRKGPRPNRENQAN